MDDRSPFYPIGPSCLTNDLKNCDTFPLNIDTISRFELWIEAPDIADLHDKPFSDNVHVLPAKLLTELDKLSIFKKDIGGIHLHGFQIPPLWRNRILRVRPHLSTLLIVVVNPELLYHITSIFVRPLYYSLTLGNTFSVPHVLSIPKLGADDSFLLFWETDTPNV